MIGGPAQLVGAAHATSSAVGTLIVGGIPSGEAFGTARITAVPTITASGRALHPYVFVSRRELSGGEWAAVAVIAQGMGVIAVSDYGATATDALGVTMIALAMLAAMLSRGPRLL